MTKVRYTVNEKGQLADRDGNVLGRLTSLTLDVANSGLPVGTTGVGGSEEQQEQKNSTPVAPKRSLTDIAVEEVYGHWLQRRPSKRRSADVPAGTARQIGRALKASYTVAELKAMIDALLDSEWHQARPETLKLSTIFATKPGGRTFEDQLDYWLERAGGPPKRSDVIGGKIEAAKKHVRFDDDSAMFTASVEFLASHGITVAWHTDAHGKRYPVFEEAR
jgi:hypothetical protein